MIKNRSLTSIALAIFAAVLFAMSGASPARADRCDDLAAQLKNQIDGLTVGKTAANVIYLSHPQTKEISLGCAGRSYSNQLFLKASVRKPPPAFHRSRRQWGRYHLHTCPRTTCSKALPAASSGWASSMATTSRPATAASTCAAYRTKTEASIAISRSTDQ